jgi:hypothetical protein
VSFLGYARIVTPQDAGEVRQVLVFQTGRQIGSAYQVIEAVTTPLGVVFTDLATNVVGLICGPMTRANIMTAYDTGTYTNFSKVERTMPDQMPIVSRELLMLQMIDHQ